MIPQLIRDRRRRVCSQVRAEKGWRRSFDLVIEPHWKRLVAARECRAQAREQYANIQEQKTAQTVPRYLPASEALVGTPTVANQCDKMAKMPQDVFICYSSHDKAVAYAACAALEEEKIRCWIAPRDVLPGREYGEAIISVINEARALLVVFSAEANGSPQVRREVERAISKGKIIIPLRIEEVVPCGSMEFALGRL